MEEKTEGLFKQLMEPMANVISPQKYTLQITTDRYIGPWNAPRLWHAGAGAEISKQNYSWMDPKHLHILKKHVTYNA